MSILRILEDINSNTKRGHKIALLQKHKSDQLFMQVIQLALDPYVNFYIRKIPSYNAAQTNPKSLQWALAELAKLSSRALTGSAGIEHLRNILSSLSSDDAVVIERIIGKDLRCGVADGIVNAVVKDYIPEYPCLLARPFDEKNIKNITYPAYSDLKADGLRANAHVAGEVVSFCGRSGRAIDLLGELEDDVVRLGNYYPVPMVFDGEFICVDQNGKVIDRKTGNGIINKAIKGTISPEEAKMVRFQVWDAITLDEFNNRCSVDTYKIRFERLLKAVESTKLIEEDKLVATLKGKTSKISVIPYKIVNNLEEAQAHFEEMLAAGYEGTILKNFCGIWEDSRSKHLVKLKAEKDCDLEIIGWNPGKGKFEGMVGSIICASSDRKVEVSISGFPDDLRIQITNEIENMMGGIAAVKYNERIKSKDRPDVDSLFLPRYEEFRYDKTVANSSAEIK